MVAVCFVCVGYTYLWRWTLKAFWVPLPSVSYKDCYWQTSRFCNFIESYHKGNIWPTNTCFAGALIFAYYTYDKKFLKWFSDCFGTVCVLDTPYFLTIFDNNRIPCIWCIINVHMLILTAKYKVHITMITLFIWAVKNLGCGVRYNDI